MKLLAAVLLLLLPLASHAEVSLSAKQSDFSPKMPGLVRVGLLAQGVMTTPQDAYENTDSGDKTSGTATVFAAIGHGMISLEVGASYVQMSDVVSAFDTSNAEHHYLTQTTYVGAPVLLKYNYIERPLAAFYVKAGAMPLWLIKQNVAEDKVITADSGTLGIFGIGGSTDLSEHTAFILDISYFQKVDPTRDGILQKGATLGIGFSYDI